MTSELRRAAKALVATRVEAFASPYPPEAAKARLERALAEAGAPRALRLAGAWKIAGGVASYEATFAPARGTQRFLSGISMALVLLVAASAWALASPGQSATLRFLLPMSTLLAAFAVPFVVAGVASRREAEEARLTRTIRAALQAGD